MIRKFALIKGEGTSREVKDLMQSPFVFTNPSGLGFTVSPETIDLSNGFFLKTNISKIPLNTIAGDLTIRSTAAVDAAAAYNTFVRWLIAANDNNELFFQYSAVTGETYECKVALDYITKTEKDGTTLTCPISFAQLTPWFKRASIGNTKVKTTQGIMAVFTFTSSIALGGDFDGGISFKTTAFTMPERLTIAVYPENTPSTDWVYLENLDISAYAGQSMSVDYSSSPEDCHIYLVDSNGVEHDIIDLVDITDTIWAKIPPTSKFVADISFPDNGADFTCEFTARGYYRTV